MAKQNKPTPSSTSKITETSKKAKPEVDPKSKSRFSDDEDDEEFDLPIDDIDGFDDLSYEDDDDF